MTPVAVTLTGADVHCAGDTEVKDMVIYSICVDCTTSVGQLGM